MIVEKLEKKLLREARVYPQHSLRMSSIGFPCDRNLVYSVVRWEDREPPDVRLLAIFKEGGNHEEIIIRDLSEAGFKVIRREEPLYLKKYRLTGHIDGVIKYRRRQIVIDIKTMSGNLFPKMNTIEDFINSPYPFHQEYIPQLNLYMFALNFKHGLLVIKNKNTGQIKEIPVPYVPRIAKAYLNKALVINERIDKIRAVLKETYAFENIADFKKKKDVTDLMDIKQEAYELIEKYMPTRQTDFELCEYCPFEFICRPDEIRQEQMRIIMDKNLLEFLEERELLAAYQKGYKKLDEKVKKIIKGTGYTHMLIGDFEINVKKTSAGAERVTIKKI